jgi:hypothetical protein
MAQSDSSPATIPPGAAASTLPQSAPATASSNAQPAAAATKPPAAPLHYHPDRFAGRAGKYYELVWGVDSMSVKYTESGEVIRFSYRVIDPKKASTLNDKKFEPSLVDPKAGVKLVVPSLEKVGQLRQSGTPEAGKVYWMAFSNKGRHVKKGDYVDVVIGSFHAQGLVVD